MEDCNLIVADCVAICSCCPCLILQFFVFLLLRLPQKLAAKTKKYAMRKILSRQRIQGVEMIQRKQQLGNQGSAEMQISHIPSCSSSEAEQVWEELIIQEGLFWFGSFWGTSCC
ncbi:hypothetical protein J5N97_027958 [Dioscorea zingiberensis]|uniref:Uncharacterized protein n=1 Tax=Dioscorea zingiberensis TaxID=325984 RepID=A0A9D5H4G5_9LILI|nr:hypothetical protein J5N97_027958 [Dioscorea zingiberensis]